MDIFSENLSVTQEDYQLPNINDIRKMSVLLVYEIKAFIINFELLYTQIIIKRQETLFVDLNDIVHLVLSILYPLSIYKYIWHCSIS